MKQQIFGKGGYKSCTSEVSWSMLNQTNLSFTFKENAMKKNLKTHWSKVITNKLDTDQLAN